MNFFKFSKYFMENRKVYMYTLYLILSIGIKFLLSPNSWMTKKQYLSPLQNGCCSSSIIFIGGDFQLSPSRHAVITIQWGNKGANLHSSAGANKKPESRLIASDFEFYTESLAYSWTSTISAWAINHDRLLPSAGGIRSYKDIQPFHIMTWMGN